MPETKDGQAGASPHNAQGVVNVAPGEGPAKQVTYEDYQKQLKEMADQLMKAEGAEVDALQKKYDALEAEIAKRATKTALTRKITELSKKLSESAESANAASQKGETAESAEDAKKGKKGVDGKNPFEKDNEDEDDTGKPEQAAAAGAKGKGMISKEDDPETGRSGPSSPWFKELWTANKKMKEQGFSGELKRPSLNEAD